LGSRPAFTLIELLVVVAGIGILAALLLPSLSQARSSAQRAQCVNSQKQLAAATEMYWEDNHGAAFLYRIGFTNNGATYWFGWLGNGPEQTRAFDPAAGILYKYIPSSSVVICPALQYGYANFKYKATGAAYGYGYDIGLDTPAGQPVIQPATFPNPANIVLFADAAQVNTFEPPATPANPMLEEFYYVSPVEPTTHFRHRLKALTAFCDAHVEAENPVPGAFDQRMPAQFVGQIGAHLCDLWSKIPAFSLSAAMNTGADLWRLIAALRAENK
jgi:prepilin-type N-terminal cleavage/methylation domain-containing protein